MLIFNCVEILYASSLDQQTDYLRLLQCRRSLAKGIDSRLTDRCEKPSIMATIPHEINIDIGRGKLSGISSASQQQAPRKSVAISEVLKSKLSA